MYRLLYILCILVNFSCLGELVREEEAKKLQLISYELRQEINELESSIEHKSNSIKYSILERGLKTEHSIPFQLAKEIQEAAFVTINKLKADEDSIFKSFGYSDQYPFLMDWDKPLSHKLISNEEIVPKTNVLVALLTINNQKYSYLKSLDDSLFVILETMELDYFSAPDPRDLRIELIKSYRSGYRIDTTGVEIWSAYVFPKDTFLINGKPKIADNHILTYSKKEWDSLNVLTIGIPLPDTTLTFYLNQL